MTPLAATLGRVESIEAYPHVAGTPTGDDWHPLSDSLADPSTLEAWFEDYLELWPGRRPDVAGSYLSWTLSRLVSRGMVVAMCTQRRAWTLSPGTISVNTTAHRDDPEESLHTGVAFDATLLVLADDPAAEAGAAGTAVEVLRDPAALVARAADEISAALNEIFDAVRTVSRFGRGSMWGAVADDINVAATMAAELGTPLDEALAIADALTDELVCRNRALRVRPTLETVTWSGGAEPLSVKGTCCLWYTTQNQPDPYAEGYCGTCPKRHRPTMLAETREHLEADHRPT